MIAAQTLQRLGYYAKEDWVDVLNSDDDSNNLLIQKLSESAVLPIRATTDSIGYDLYADNAVPITIPAGEIIPIPTGIAIKLGNVH
jgi:hypothetical protein